MQEKISIEALGEKYSFIVYGTGYVAGKLMEALKRKGIDNKVKAFCVTDPKGEAECFGKPLLKYTQVKMLPNEMMLVAIHNSYEKQILANLNEAGISNVRWILTSDLYDLFMGEPLLENRGIKVNIREITSNLVDYNLVIRYLAVKNFYGENDFGKEIYKKAFSRWTTPETANNRLNALSNLIKSFDTDGYNSKYRVLITDKYRVIDGLHRTAVAIHKNQETIICDKYIDKIDIDKVMGGGSSMPWEFLTECNLTKKELEQISFTQKMLMRGDYA